ncbi:MAG: Blue-light-activated protein [Anaeromyxobacteraceae bacterium]|nr:Blue-light-activated protein [Anaeromyxobacteraceae bacterium]
MDALPIGVVFAEYPRGGPPAIVTHNAAYGRIVGVKAHPSTPFAELPFSLYLPDRMTRIPPEEWPAPTAARTGEPVPERELHLRRSNGEWRVLMVSAAPLPRVPGDRVGRAAGVLLDVTERRRAEEDLSRRGQLLRLVIETSPDPVFVKNRESQVLFANPATLRAIGLPMEQVVGHSDREFYEDAVVGMAIEANDRRIMERGVEEVVEETVPSPGGDRVFLSTKTPWRDSTGQVIGLVGIARDITQRKWAEEALRGSERRFRALIEHASDMLLLVDGSGTIRFWSPAASEALGWTESEVLGKEALELVHPEDRHAVVHAFRNLSRAAGGSVPHRARMRHRDGGYRVVDGVGRDLRNDPAIGAVVLNVRDVTEQARTEELLLQSQKLDSIGRLAGGIAHDFNNLLTVILCSVESGGEALDAGRPVAREDIEQIREAGERARDLTSHLLAFARRQVIAPATVDLNAMLAGSERLLQRLLGETIRLETSPGPDLWPVRCDTAQMEHVLFNLAVGEWHDLRRAAAAHPPDGGGDPSPSAGERTQGLRDRAPRRGRPRSPRGGGPGPSRRWLPGDRRVRCRGRGRGHEGRGPSPDHARDRRDHAGHDGPAARRPAPEWPARAAGPLPLRLRPRRHRAARCAGPRGILPGQAVQPHVAPVQGPAGSRRALTPACPDPGMACSRNGQRPRGPPGNRALRCPLRRRDPCTRSAPGGDG